MNQRCTKSPMKICFISFGTFTASSLPWCLPERSHWGRLGKQENSFSGRLGKQENSFSGRLGKQENSFSGRLGKQENSFSCLALKTGKSNFQYCFQLCGLKVGHGHQHRHKHIKPTHHDEPSQDCNRWHENVKLSDHHTKRKSST